MDQLYCNAPDFQNIGTLKMSEDALRRAILLQLSSKRFYTLFRIEFPNDQIKNYTHNDVENPLEKFIFHIKNSAMKLQAPVNASTIEELWTLMEGKKKDVPFTPDRAFEYFYEKEIFFIKTQPKPVTKPTVVVPTVISRAPVKTQGPQVAEKIVPPQRILSVRELPRSEWKEDLLTMYRRLLSQ